MLPFREHLEQTERAVDAVESMLPGRTMVHLGEREFDDLALHRHMAQRLSVSRCQHLTRQVTVRGEKRSLASQIQRVQLVHAGEVVRREDDPRNSYQPWVGETQGCFSGPALRGVARKKRKP